MDDELTIAIKGGMSVSAIVSELGISQHTVRKRMQELGLKAQRRRDALPTAGIIEAYQNGMSMRDIKKKFGASPTQVYAILSDLDIPIRKTANANARQRALDEAIEMYVAGSRIVDIVAETGVVQPTLHAELAERNIPLRRPRKNV